MEDLNIERVRAMLHARLSGRGIDVDKVYVNGIHKFEDLQETYSQTLVWAFFLQLQDREIPTLKGRRWGCLPSLHILTRPIVSRAWTLMRSTEWAWTSPVVSGDSVNG
jgi:hypothetical protein